MSAFSTLTRTQRVLLVLLALGVVCAFGDAVLLAILPAEPEAALVEEMPTEDPTALALEFGTPKPTDPAKTATRIPTRTATVRSSAAAGQTRAATATVTLPPTPTSTPLPTVMPTLAAAAAGSAMRDLANMELDPRSRFVSKTTFFTSACYGPGVNLLQDRDNMTPADWSSAEDRKCIFGYAVNPADEMPAGRYSVFGGPDGVPRFYVIPPEAFAYDQRNLKQLSQIQLIVDPDQGCDALGSIGVTADGINYQCSACAFLRGGGICPGGDGGKALALPTNANNILDPSTNGGAYGFVGFPLVIFRRGFSLYFTGRAGYAPPRIYFDDAVDTLLPGVNVKTTAEMSSGEIAQVASQFDRVLSGTNPIAPLASLEQEATSLTSSQVSVKSKEQAVFNFAAPPGAVLSSIVWRIRPLNNTTKPQFLETNLCLVVNGEQYCFTGVEDFAHCAFFAPCRTGYASLIPTAQGEYLATRYFPSGSAPIVGDGKITVKSRAPDIGTVLEMEVKVRVRNAR